MAARNPRALANAYIHMMQETSRSKMATDKKQFSLIEPADEVPDKKGYKQAKYIEIFNEFFESGPKRQR